MAAPADVELSPGAPLWQWAYQGITSRATEMMQHVEGVRLGEDIEAVHDMRVWSRRLAAAMRIFASCFPEAEYRRLLKEARRVTRSLGEVRDLDVQMEHFRAERDEALPVEAPAIEYLLAVLDAQRHRARRPMLEALDQLCDSRYVERLQEYLREQADAYCVGLPPEIIWGPSPEARATGLSGRAPFHAAAPTVLTTRLEELYAFEPYTHRRDAVVELHEMRIAAKWLRYSMELFAPAYATRLKKPLSAVRKVQERLGVLHDSDVRQELLGRMLEEPLDPRGLEALGMMLPDTVTAGLAALREREARIRGEAYDAFYNQWCKLEAGGFREQCLREIQAPNAGGAE